MPFSSRLLSRIGDAAVYDIDLDKSIAHLVVVEEHRQIEGDHSFGQSWYERRIRLTLHTFERRLLIPGEIVPTAAITATLAPRR